MIPDFDGNAEFHFDEVVAEGGIPSFGLGTGDLERLTILSPANEVPAVGWKRNRITVRPKDGWRPNTVYRVELLPGIADLRGNRSPIGRVITFTTGAPLPETTLRGRIVDWGTQRPHREGLVEAVHLSDSLVYRRVADSAGRFVLGPLPPGDYLVYGVLDQNNDHRRQPRESYDTVRVGAGRDTVGEVWAFRHDTIPARISTAELNDTLSLVLTFSQQLDPYQRLPGDSVRVRLLPDSVPLAVLAILPRGAYDTTYPLARSADSARARADSIKAREDSVRADSIARAREAGALRIPGAERRRPVTQDTTGTGPLRTKPPLFDKLYVRVGRRPTPGSKYVVDVHGIKTVSGIVGAARGVAQIPAEKPVVDTAKPKPDTGSRAGSPQRSAFSRSSLSVLTSYLSPFRRP